MTDGRVMADGRMSLDTSWGRMGLLDGQHRWTVLPTILETNEDRF